MPTIDTWTEMETVNFYQLAQVKHLETSFFFFLIPSIYLNHAPGLLMMKNWRIPVNDCLPSVEVRSGLFAAESRRHGTL